MKVYIVIERWGTYEDRYEKINSVWLNPIDAENRKKKIIDDNYIMVNMPAPYSEDDYINERLSEKQDEDYNNWQQNKWAAEDAHEPNVEEYEVN